MSSSNTAAQEKRLTKPTVTQGKASLAMPAPDGVLEFLEEDGKRTELAWTAGSIKEALDKAPLLALTPEQENTFSKSKQLASTPVHLRGVAWHTEVSVLLNELAAALASK